MFFVIFGYCQNYIRLGIHDETWTWRSHRVYASWNCGDHLFDCNVDNGMRISIGRRQVIHFAIFSVYVANEILSILHISRYLKGLNTSAILVACQAPTRIKLNIFNELTLEPVTLSKRMVVQEALVVRDTV